MLPTDPTQSPFNQEHEMQRQKERSAAEARSERAAQAAALEEEPQEEGEAGLLRLSFSRDHRGVPAGLGPKDFELEA